MVDYNWVGGNASGTKDPSIVANWARVDGQAHSSVPGDNDKIIFGESATIHCIFEGDTFPSSGAFTEVEVTGKFHYRIEAEGTASTIKTDLLRLGHKANTPCIKADVGLTIEFGETPTTTVYDGAGSSFSYKPLVVITTNTTPFFDTTSRANTTYNFGSQNFSMVDGIYPDITFTGTMYAKKIYSDASRTEFNTYGSVDILDFNGGSVKSKDYDTYDYEKEFLFEGTLNGIGEFFRFGHTTTRFKTIGSGTFYNFPVTGYTTFGSADGNFYTQYNKVVIEPQGVSTNYWSIPAGLILECDELVIKDGGRLYGPTNSILSSVIRCVKRPTIYGDWNFKQITDGIYQSVDGFSNTPVFNGGTGRNTLTKNAVLYGNGMGEIGLLPITGNGGKYLKVKSDESGLEWGS